MSQFCDRMTSLLNHRFYYLALNSNKNKKRRNESKKNYKNWNVNTKLINKIMKQHNKQAINHSLEIIFYEINHYTKQHKQKDKDNDLSSFDKQLALFLAQCGLCILGFFLFFFSIFFFF